MSVFFSFIFNLMGARTASDELRALGWPEVGHHVQHVYQKAGVRSRAAATLGPSSPGVRGLDSPHHRRRAAAPRTKRRRELFLATTKVEDFDRWWSVFSTTSLEKRKQHGSKGSHSFRDPNEEGRVWVLFDWDAEGWQNFISDPEVPAILQEAGHASRPQVAELAGQLDG